MSCASDNLLRLFYGVNIKLLTEAILAAFLKVRMSLRSY